MFRTNLRRQVLQNNQYRKVLHTTPTQQLVVMCLRAHEQIGIESHPGVTQMIGIEQGRARVETTNTTYRLRPGDVIVVPPRRRHNVINAGRVPLKLFSVYSPPEH